MEMTHEKGAEEILSVVNYCKRDISFEITNADGFCSIDLTMRYNDEDGENQLTEFEYDTEKTKGVPTGRGFCHEREDIGSAIADEFKKKLPSLTKPELQKISSQVDAIIVQVCDEEGIIDDI